MGIYSCKNCVPPERHPGCHGKCQKYLAEKAKYEAEKEALNKQRAIERGIMDRRGYAVYKAMKNRRKGRNYDQ